MRMVKEDGSAAALLKNRLTFRSLSPVRKAFPAFAGTSFDRHSYISLLHASFSRCVMPECSRPRCIRCRHRSYQRVFEAEDRGRRIHGETMRHHVPMGRKLLAAALTLSAKVPDVKSTWHFRCLITFSGARDCNWFKGYSSNRFIADIGQIKGKREPWVPSNVRWDSYVCH